MLDFRRQLTKHMAKLRPTAELRRRITQERMIFFNQVEQKRPEHGTRKAEIGNDGTTNSNQLPGISHERR